MEAESTGFSRGVPSEGAPCFGDEFIDHRIEREVFKRGTPIGIISSENATSSWQVGSLGDVKWIVSPTTPITIQYQDDGPQHFESFSSESMDDVEVIIVEGGATIPKELWFCSQAKIVLKFDPMLTSKPWSGKGRGRKRKSLHSIADGWKFLPEVIIYHADQGGVSNGRFKLSIYSKVDIDWSLPKSTFSSLEAVLDSKLLGSVMPIPPEGEPQTYQGLIHWRNRFEPVIAPTVYHSCQAVKRKLNLKELAGVLDFPSDRIELMTDTQLKVLTQTTSIPGKVYYAGIFCLDSYDRITNPLQTPTKRIKLS